MPAGLKLFLPLLLDRKKPRAEGDAGPSGAPSMGGKKSAPVHHNPIQAVRFRSRGSLCYAATATASPVVELPPELNDEEG